MSPKDAVWIETGTFMGDTTARLAEDCQTIHTIEPVRPFYERAVKRFSGNAAVACHFGTSEAVFESVLETALAGGAGSANKPLCIFLDGHFSGGRTHEGKTHTPIRLEMDALSRVLDKITHALIILDDARLFGPTPGTYPSRGEVEDWAKRHHLFFELHHDMFVLSKSPA